MADLFARDTEIVLLILVCAIWIGLPIQLMLCFKAKKLLIKLLPIVVLAVATFAFYIMAITAKTWVALIFIMIAASCGVAIMFSGIAWLIWAIVKLIKRKQ